MRLISKQVLLLSALILFGSLQTDLFAAASASSAATKSKVTEQKSSRKYVGAHRAPGKHVAKHRAAKRQVAKHRAASKRIGKHRAEKPSKAANREKIKSMAAEIFKGMGEGALELAGGRGLGQSNGPNFFPDTAFQSRTSVSPDVSGRSARPGRNSRF